MDLIMAHTTVVLLVAIMVIMDLILDLLTGHITVLITVLIMAHLHSDHQHSDHLIVVVAARVLVPTASPVNLPSVQ